MNNKIKLDIGSGRAHFEDYITVDKDPAVGADFCIDVENLISIMFCYDESLKNFEKKFSGKCDEIRAHHILEHFRPENKVKMMYIFWELLKPGGILDIEVPIFPHPASVQDPTHLSFWMTESFWYFTKGNKFGEAFTKRHSEYPVPLFEFVEEWRRGDWAYGIKLKKSI